MLETEGNDFPSSANRVNLGETANGSLSTKSDWDYFKVAVDSGGVLKVDFNAPTSSSNFYFNVTIYDSSLKILASDFVGASTSFSLGVPGAGSYYVAVTSSSFFSSAQYGLTVSMAPGSASGFESESNNTLATASAMVLDQTIKGQMASSQDADYYRVAATTTGVLVVDFAASKASANPSFTLAIYDAAGKLLQSNDTGNALTLSAAVSAPGNYYVKVTQADRYDGGNYSLTVHNDGFSTLAAKTLAGVGSVPLALSASHDWYSVNLTAGTSYVFGLAGSSSGGGTLADPSLTLSYANGAVLETCDNLEVWSAAIRDQTGVPDPQIAFTAPKTGAYYLMIAGNGGTGSYTLNVKTDLRSDLTQGLLYLQSNPNERWNSALPLGTPVSLTYSFMNSTADGAAEDGETGFVAMTSVQKQVVSKVLAQYRGIANITFTETTDQSNAHLRFGTSYQPDSSGVTYTSYLGNGALQQMDVFLDNASGMPSLSDGSYGLETLIHEIGHALGLKHPGNYNSTGDYGAPQPYLPLAWDNRKFTAMSYLDNPDTTVYHSTPGLLDIAAVQYLYGANISGKQAQTFSFGNSSPFVSSLLSSGTQDTIDISNQSLGSTIFLTPGTLSSIGVGANGGPAHNNVAIPFGASVVSVIDGPAADLIVGNTLDNKFIGFSTGDTIDGGGGNDTLVLSATSSGLNNAADGQLQNVQTVDASAAAAGVKVDLHSQNESLTFIGGSFSDTITAGPGWDLLIGGGGNDSINGGIGMATAGYGGKRSSYLVSKTSTAVTVRDNDGTDGSDGTDTLTSIERLRFSDVKLAFDTSGSAGNTAKIIGAAFGVGYLSNTPENASIKGQGISIFDAGATLQQLSAAIVKLPVFVNMAGSSSNSDFVKFIFNNVIGQAATEDEVNFLSSYLNNGMTQGDFLATVANLEVNLQHVGLVGVGGLASTGLEYS